MRHLFGGWFGQCGKRGVKQGETRQWQADYLDDLRESGKLLYCNQHGWVDTAIQERDQNCDTCRILS